MLIEIVAAALAALAIWGLYQRSERLSEQKQALEASLGAAHDANTKLRDSLLASQAAIAEHRMQIAHLSTSLRARSAALKEVKPDACFDAPLPAAVHGLLRDATDRKAGMHDQ